MSQSHDVVIIGGGVVGSSAAYHLVARDSGLDVIVVEKDPSYEFAATGRSFGGVRILFSQEENIAMSLYGHEFYGDFAARTAVDEVETAIDFRRQGYLFMALDAEEAANIELNLEVQRGMGCEVLVLDAQGLAERYPSLTTEDVLLAVLAPNDGWIDPHGALMGFRAKARSLGAAYVHGEVVEIEHDASAARGVRLGDGTTIAAKTVILAAGAWSGAIAAEIGLSLPVVPLARSNFHFETREAVEPLPLFRNLPGFGGRPEGSGYICGYTDIANAGRFDFEPRHEVFEDILWPGLAHRVKAFEAVKVTNAWAGHYAYNSFDGNLIIGPWRERMENLLIATGFSGHGLQQAPAVGRALAELVLDGGYREIDLERFDYARIPAGRAEPERGMKA